MPKGFDVFHKELTLFKSKKTKALERGLYKAGLFIQRKAQKLTPVDTGNLKGSAFTKIRYKRGKPKVIVGFSASYALRVHEDLNMRHTNGRAKFLEVAIRNNRARAMKMVKKEVDSE